MKPFTQAILFLGVITLVFYALNPVEAFDPLVGPSPGQPPKQIDLAILIAKYKTMRPEEREQLRIEIQRQRNQLGLVNSGFFDNGLHPELNQQSTTPPADTPDTSEADAAAAAVTTKMEALEKAQKLVKAGDGTAITLSDVQGLINSNVQSQLANQPIQNCGLSRAYTPTVNDSPNFNEILKAADEQRQQQKEKRRKSHKHAINTQQMTYRPSAPVTAASCAPPDPTVWVKRKEIPCWSCTI
jgi:hypothetical protein